MHNDEQHLAIGYVEVTLTDVHGNSEVRRFKNRLTTYAISAMASLLVDQYVKTPSRIVLGTGAPPPPITGPLPSDEALWNENASTRRAVDVKDTWLSTTSEFGVTYEVNEFNDIDFTEAGLEDDDGNLWAHVIIELTKSSLVPQTASIRWKIAHTEGGV